MELDIGGKVKQIMDAKEITPKQLSKASGINTSHLSHIINNHRVPSVKNLVKIADALYCSTDVLLGRKQ